jgi:hypothetical protein
MCDVKAPFDGTLKFQKGSFPSLWRVGDGPFELADSPVPNSSAAPLPLPSHVGLAAAKPQAHGTGTATATQRRASPPPASSPADPRLLVPTSPAHGSQSRLLHAPHVALTASPARGTGRGDADAPQRGRTGRRGGAGRRTCTCTGDGPARPHHAAVFPNFICSFRQRTQEMTREMPRPGLFLHRASPTPTGKTTRPVHATRDLRSTATRRDQARALGLPPHPKFPNRTGERDLIRRRSFFSCLNGIKFNDRERLEIDYFSPPS